jgi:hypothetical protein
VWNHDNVERVRKDEKAAQLEEELKQRRAEEAVSNLFCCAVFSHHVCKDQEHRLSVLRARAGQQRPQVLEGIEEEDEGSSFSQKRQRQVTGGPGGDDAEEAEEYKPLSSSSAKPAKPQHVNFFEDLERGEKVSLSL